jgi:hypothetical protein
MKVNIQGDASASYNAGFFIGRKWGKTSYYADPKKTHDGLAGELALFVTPSVVTMDQTVSLDKRKDKSNELGLGVGLIGVISYRDFSAGLAIGYDRALTGNGKNWYYNKVPWIGLGFGYKLGILGGK